MSGSFTPHAVLVTGGAGFIGSNFINHFMAGNPGCRVVNLDTLTYAGNLENLRSVENKSNYRFVKGDISDGGLVAALLHDEKIDAVVHFAAESHVDRSIMGPEVFVRTNVLGTQILLEESRKHLQSGCVDDFRYLQISTDEVYGSLGKTGYFTEETPLAANSPYSASKAGADLLARAYHETFGFPALTTRCSNNYGPYQFPEKLIPLFVTRLLEHRTVPLYGDGGNVRDWLHVDDHCQGVQLVVEHGVAGAAYNIGGGEELSNKALTQRILDAMGAGWDQVEYVADRPGHDRRYALDDARVRALGYRPRHTFADGLAETIEWYRTNQAWWRPLLVGAP
ncbi:MAG TPA: dTDP-glucose 4,6-dehydratase [Geobacteraceae bacterium]|nr:dTDP-glucose 4,6-dehydratase [Geobacteraceae bacterium]